MAIILEKSGDQHRINLEKGSSSFSGEIVINLDWSKGGLLKQMFGKPVDLDLGCFYELRDGSKMLIDGLQFSHNRGGNRHRHSKRLTAICRRDSTQSRCRHRYMRRGSYRPSRFLPALKPG